MTRPPANRTMPYEIVAQNLEKFGTSRAHFDHLSDKQRIVIGKRITIHCSRAAVNGTFFDKEAHIFYHLCGSVGIGYQESRAMWRNSTEGRVTIDDIESED